MRFQARQDTLQKRVTASAHSTSSSCLVLMLRREPAIPGKILARRPPANGGVPLFLRFWLDGVQFPSHILTKGLALGIFRKTGYRATSFQRWGHGAHEPRIWGCYKNYFEDHTDGPHADCGACDVMLSDSSQLALLQCTVTAEWTSPTRDSESCGNICYSLWIGSHGLLLFLRTSSCCEVSPTCSWKSHFEYE